MAKRCKAAALAIAALWLSGCGTICNLVSDDPVPYGGMQKDQEFFTKWVAESDEDWGLKDLIGQFCIGVTETLLTCIGDLLTLPLANYLQQRREEYEAAEIRAARQKPPIPVADPVTP